MNETEKVTDGDTIKILCPRLILTRREPGLQWLIGSPFFPPFTIISTFKSIHTSSSSSPDFIKESDDLRTLLIKGFDIIGGLIVGGSSSDDGEKNAREVIVWAGKLRELVIGGGGRENLENRELIGAVAGLSGGDVKFFVERRGNVTAVDSVVYEENQEKFVWERGCLFRCNLPIKMPVYLPVKNKADAEKMYLRAAEVVASSFKDPLVTYMVERLSKDISGAPQPVIIRGVDLDFNADLTNIKLVGEKSAQDSDAKKLTCAHFCSKSKSSPALISVEVKK